MSPPSSPPRRPGPRPGGGVGGVFDDANGNQREEVADVVLFFNQMSWIAGNVSISAFDSNGNGRIAFADVVRLFNHL